MKTIITTLLLVISGLIRTHAQSPAPTQPESQLSNLWAHQGKRVLVAAHRGDWRNAPENSIQGLKNCIAMGVDISEFDLKRTKDGELIILHDKTLDRSTNGKGKPEDFTLDEIKKIRLLSGTGHPTSHPIPTFKEMLTAAKGKIIVDIDKGYEYYDEVIRQLIEQQMLGQAILNIYGLPFDSLTAQHAFIPETLTLQLIINPQNPDAVKIIDTYKQHKKTILQLIFKDDKADILSQVPKLKDQYAIWFNSLWPEQCGEHDDDKAVEEDLPDATWGWLVNKGADIIQTDRPALLIQYLRSKGRH